MRISYLFPIQFLILYQSCSLGCPKAALSSRWWLSLSLSSSHIPYGKCFRYLQLSGECEVGSMAQWIHKCAAGPQPLPEGGWNINQWTRTSQGTGCHWRASIHNELEASEKSPSGNRSWNIWRGWLRQGMKSKSWNKAKHNIYLLSFSLFISLWAEGSLCLSFSISLLPCIGSTVFVSELNKISALKTWVWVNSGSW